jgi:hypothetical protein
MRTCVWKADPRENDCGILATRKKLNHSHSTDDLLLMRHPRGHDDCGISATRRKKSKHPHRL